MQEDNNMTEQSYAVKVSGNGVNIEQEVLKSVAFQVIGVVMGYSDNHRNEPADLGCPQDHQISATAVGGTEDPKAFIAHKRPSSDVERVACLAYYLSKYRKVTQFKTREITALNTEAAQVRFSNTTVATNNAVKTKYLTPAGGGRKQITTKGEAVVEALPDRSKVKQALEENDFRKPRHKKNKKNQKDNKNTG